MDAPFPSLKSVDSYFPSHPSPAPLPVAHGSTRSFWLTSSPTCNFLADTGSDSPLPTDGGTDILIIGSGISGISTLYHLVQQLRRSSRPTTRIVIVEAREFCSGATGRNGGHCTAYNTVAFKAHLKAEGGNVQEAIKHVLHEQRTVDSILGLIEENGWEEEVDLVKGGNIHLVSSDEERRVLEEQLDAAKEAGLDVSQFRWLSKEECTKYIQGGSKLSGLWLPGNNLYPLKFVTKLYELACSQATEIGVQVSLFTHTPVTSINEDSKGHPWIANTPRGAIRAKQIVHATNAYASHLLHGMAYGKQKVVPCRGQVVAVRPPTNKGKDGEVFWTAGFSYNEGFEYFFQRPASNATTRSTEQKIPYIILGGGRSIAPAPYELDIADDSSLEPHVSEYLRDFLPKNFPKLYPAEEEGNVKVDFEWSGIMGFTESRNPYVGRVYDEKGEKQKGQYVQAGFSGHGMSRAGSCAEYTASLVVAEAEGREAELPDWMPRSFLTEP